MFLSQFQLDFDLAAQNLMSRLIPVGRQVKDGGARHADSLFRRQAGRRLAGQHFVFSGRAGTVLQLVSDDRPFLEVGEPHI
jgi:hypothetical protein